MFRKFFIIILPFFLSLTMVAQDLNSWRCYLKREHTTALVKAETKVFALADGALYSFSPKEIEKDNRSVSLYDKTFGLNDVNLTHINYNTTAQCLFCYYSNGSIDLLRSDETYYISAIKDAKDIRQKAIKESLMDKNKLYFCGGFGLCILDLDKNFIESTFFRGEEIESLALDQEKKLLYILKKGEVLSGDLNKNLQDPSQWKSLNYALPKDDIKKKVQLTQLIFQKNKLFGLGNSGRVYLIDESQAKPIPLSIKIKSLKKEDEVLYLISNENGLYVLSHLDNNVDELAKNGVLDFIGPYKNQSLLLLKKDNTLVTLKKSNKKWQETNSTQIQTDSPFDNTYFSMRTKNGILYTVNGGRHTNRYNNKGVVQMFDGIKWTNLSKGLKKFLDPVAILPYYSGEKGHCYVGTWGEGLYEFQLGKEVKHYDIKNSKLMSATDDPNRNDYLRVGSLAYDRQHTLWTAQGGGYIVSMTEAGKWKRYTYEGALGTNSFEDQIVLPNGTHWIADHHNSDGNIGVFIFDNKGTETKSDDEYAHYRSFVDTKGKVLSIGKVKAMTLDRNGTLWLGSSIGFCSVVRASQIPKEHALPIISRPIGGDEPPYYYVLDKTPVSAIAVDNLNRKWIGTERNGLYLVSPDGVKVLNHYTAENSPLLTNKIVSLAFDDELGRLYIGSNKGLNSLDISTDVESQSSTPKAIAYPNPLRPEDPDIITIKGLPANAVLLITDTYGHSILKTKTTESVYKWDVYKSNGHRLPEGVYTVHIYAENSDTPQQLRLLIMGSDHY